jgi:uncharacterized integral membrane protein
MGVLVALTVGLVFWIAAWALGAKAFDAFLVTALLTMSAATARIVAPYVNQLLGREPALAEELGPAER